jgi:hypothetical protein
MPANRSRPRLALVVALALGVNACGDNTSDGDTGSDAATEAETDGTETGECSTVLELTNDTSNTIEVIHFLACDMSDGNDYPVPPPGLASGEMTSVPFPGPGCWLLSYEGEGCYNDVIIMTDELGCGDVYAWTPDDSDHICTG